MNEPQVLARIEGAVGRITLNRPQALHALNTGMIALMTEALLAWRTNPAVKLVLIDHAGERGFCAGGDIRLLAESGAGDGVEARVFFFTEYRLNALLHDYPKPTVALLDGITMGGGMGLAMPCRYRVATERTSVAMPETGIGLFPDVGGGWFLPRLPGKAGLWLALTGARIKAADCLYLGIANASVRADEIGAVVAELVRDPDAVRPILRALSGGMGLPPLAARQAEIDSHFAGPSVEAIFADLAAADSDWTREQLAMLATKCPQALKVAFRQLRLGGLMARFSDNMAMENRIAARLVRRHDFLEGVRAVIVDKDNAPRWHPAILADISEATLEEIFAPLPSPDLWTPLGESVA